MLTMPSFKTNLTNQVILFALLLLLNSCSRSAERLVVVLDSYRGYNELSLNQKFGQPSKSFLSNGSKVLEFEFVEHNFNLNSSNGSNLFDNDSLSINSQPNSKYASVGYGDVNASYSINECTLAFTVDPSGIVRTWDYRGNSCTRYATRSNVNRQYLIDLPRIMDKTYAFNFKKTKKGLLITDLSPLSSAYQTGLRTKDLIIKMNDLDLRGVPIELAHDQIAKHQELNLTILRGKEEIPFLIKKSEIARLYLYKKSIRKFLGFN